MSDLTPEELAERQAAFMVAVKEKIDLYGWMIQMVGAGDGEPQFAYTVGLFSRNFEPEIICFTLPQDTVHGLLNDVARRTSEGLSLKGGMVFDDLANLPMTLIEVDNEKLRDYFGTAIRFYKGPVFPAVQLVWPDPEGRFPWDEGYDPEGYPQPLLGPAPQ